MAFVKSIRRKKVERLSSMVIEGPESSFFYDYTKEWWIKGGYSTLMII